MQKKGIFSSVKSETILKTEKTSSGNIMSISQSLYEGKIPVENYSCLKMQWKNIHNLGKEHVIRGEKCFRFNYVSEDNTARIRDDLYQTESGETIIHRTRTPTIEAPFPAFIESTVRVLEPAELEIIVKDYQESKTRNHSYGCHRCEIFSITFFLVHLFHYLHRGVINMNELCSDRIPSLGDLLKKLLPSKKIAFYPSCGNTNWSKALEFDADLFIFADYWGVGRNSLNRQLLDDRLERDLLFTLLGQLDDDIRYEKVLNRNHGSSSDPRDSRKNFWEKFVKSAPVEIIGVVKTPAANLFFWNRKRDGGDRQGQNVQWGILFFEDNNIVINRIQRYGGRINYFIGLKDGCGEGGNYECVNEPPFFNKVLDCMADDGMTYISDHGFGHDKKFEVFLRLFSEYYPHFTITAQPFTHKEQNTSKRFLIRKNPHGNMHQEIRNEDKHCTEFVNICEDLAEKFGDSKPDKMQFTGRARPLTGGEEEEDYNGQGN
jgi:hypothetical protein